MIAGTHTRIGGPSATNLDEEVAKWHEAAQSSEEIVSGHEMTNKAGFGCVLCCLAAFLLLLWHTKRTSSLGGALHGCKSRGTREVCAMKHATGSRRLRPTHCGQGCGVSGVATLLMLATWLGGCAAAGTICSNEPTVCNGTYSGTSLCAPLPLPCATNIGRQRGP